MSDFGDEEQGGTFSIFFAEGEVLAKQEQYKKAIESFTKVTSPIGWLKYDHWAYVLRQAFADSLVPSLGVPHKTVRHTKLIRMWYIKTSKIMKLFNYIMQRLDTTWNVFWATCCKICLIALVFGEQSTFLIFDLVCYADHFLVIDKWLTCQ